MRILHINDSLGFGGTETSIIQSVLWLQSQGCDLHVAVLRGPIEHNPNAQDLNIHYLDGHPRDGIIAARRKMRDLLVAFNPQIVHLHSFFGHLVLNLARPATRPFLVVSSLHNLGYDAWPAKTPNKRVRKWLHGRMLDKADWTVSVSQAVAEHYQGHLGIKTDEIVPDPAPGAAFLLSRSTVPDQKDAIRTIALPGRITREKGHSVAIEALELLKAEGRVFRFEALGGGPLEADIRRLIRSSTLSDSATVSGSLAHDKLLQRLASADICIIPSLHEGLGIVALEAMTLGVPVIASNAGGLAEVIDHDVTGLTVPRGDAEALGEAIACLLDNPERAQSLAKEAKKVVLERYGIDHIGQRWLRTYESLLSV